MPLGFSDQEHYRQVSVKLEAGDLLLFYSDGVLQAPSPTGQAFGQDRLGGWLREHGALAPEPLARALRQALRDFTQSARLANDFVCIAVRLEA